jgi:para-nitrobenzyl esterase
MIHTTTWRRWASLVSVMLALLVPPARPADAAPIVMTGSGPVRGVRGPAVDSYQGIPYAQPPTGDLRWRAPRPVRPWTTAIDATTPGPACAQNEPGKPAGTTLPGSGEDCLYLNVTTPRGQRRPVIVWIHGGGNTAGTGSEYDATRMATRGDVVVVTINYRLGVFGFFGYPGLSGSGAFGLQDQQAALRWVRANAAAFGGDPGNVTVAGESAGGVDICAQLTAPGSAGLFARAILQSGSCRNRIPTRTPTSPVGCM